jgi:anti-sigma B factor antagonist
MTGEEFQIKLRESGGVRIAEVSGRLTIGHASDQLNEVLIGLAEKGARKILVNLNAVPQIDSSGISTLVRNSITLGRDGGSLHLVCKAGRVRDALSVTRLVEAIPTFDSEAAALASFE